MFEKCVWFCIEGGDGTGKTTQVMELKKRLEDCGERVYHSHVFDTKLGKELKALFLNNELTNLEEILLLFITREEYIKEIQNIACEYDVIITDRWLLSIRAMQGLEKSNLSLIYELEQKIERFGKPDLTFILDVNENICRNRMSVRNQALDRIESKDLQFHKEVRCNFLRYGDVQTNTYILDGSKEKDSIGKDIYDISISFINELRRKKDGCDNF